METFQKQTANLESRKTEYWKGLECHLAPLYIEKGLQKAASPALLTGPEVSETYRHLGQNIHPFWQAMRGPIVLIPGPWLITPLLSTSPRLGPTQEQITAPLLESHPNLGWQNNRTMCRDQKPGHYLPIKLNGFIIIAGCKEFVSSVQLKMLTAD